jgi:hypothetical protein
VQEVKLTWSDRMREEGKRETLLRQLTAKFGLLSPVTKSNTVGGPVRASIHEISLGNGVRRSSRPVLASIYERSC